MSTDTDVQDPPPYACWSPEGSLTAIIGSDFQILWNPAVTDVLGDTPDTPSHAQGVQIDEDLFSLLNIYGSRLLSPDGSRAKLERALRRVPVLEGSYRSAVAYLPHGEFLVARVRGELRLYHQPGEYQLPWLHLIDQDAVVVPAWFGSRKALIHNVPIQDRAVIVHATARMAREGGPMRIGWVFEPMTHRVTHEPYGQPLWRPRTFETVSEAPAC